MPFLHPFLRGFPALFLACLALKPASPAAAPRWWAEARETRQALKPARIPELLEARIKSLEDKKKPEVEGETMPYREDLARFYAERKHKPAWIAYGRHAVPAAWQLLDAVKKSRLEGLDPADYHAETLDSLIGLFGRRFGWGTGPSPRTAAHLDLLLTDAYLRLASDLLKGRTYPISRKDTWHISPEEPDLAVHLKDALDGRGRIRESLRELAPAGREYGIMKYWLAEYRAIQERGGWTDIPRGGTLAVGSRGERVALLCERLSAEKGMEPGSCGEAFDSSLARAVARYQAHHGLPATGKADEATVRELNVSVKERIRQIQLNLECWRWLPRDLGTRHVRVNIADYSLVAWEDGKPGPSMRVVVGTKEDSTPVFSDKITSVILNPPWNVPDSIAAWELLPEIQKDPEYLERQGMELVTSWRSGAPTVDPDTVDWRDVDPAEFPYRIRQKSGDGSALGKVKFDLTNPFQIYLHDTPSKSYFARHRRALSHGCVRVEKPVDLALWLLRPDMSRQDLEKAIGKGVTRALPVAGPGVPVHILYWTAFADPEGGLQFRKDVYNWNRRMVEDIRGRTAGL